MQQLTTEAVRVAEDYYDSTDADEFYSNIWGGEDIHIGIYESDLEPIADASRRTVERMADRLVGVSPSSTVLDIGAGYGGAARSLARRFGCRVVCLNVSEKQNARNARLNAEQGLAESVSVVHGTFEALPLPDASCDVVWSQDAILHSGNRSQVLSEVHRVLRPSGQLIFTDPMQSDDCPRGVLGPVLDRIHLESLGSVAFYRNELSRLGFRELGVEDLTAHLVRHYGRVRSELATRREEMSRRSSAAYVSRMLDGLEHWIAAGTRGHLSWAILHFRK